MNQPMALNQFINQPVNQAIRGQPLRPQNASIQSYNNLTANQKYENLTKGTDPFVNHRLDLLVIWVYQDNPVYL
ncbi:19571_t:CDS:2, partial [Gigaspora margarita]